MLTSAYGVGNKKSRSRKLRRFVRGGLRAGVRNGIAVSLSRSNWRIRIDALWFGLTRNIYIGKCIAFSLLPRSFSHFSYDCIIAQRERARLKFDYMQSLPDEGLKGFRSCIIVMRTYILYNEIIIAENWFGKGYFFMNSYTVAYLKVE